jgi:hypothetical protein
MRYFSLLPTIKYKFTNGEYTIVDLFSKVGFNEEFFKNTTLYYEEQRDNILSPERLSLEKYETFDYYWLLMMANKVVDVNTDWPTIQEDFGTLLETESKKTTYYIYENANIIENDILYVDETSYGVIESWNPFYKAIVIKENYNLPTDLTGTEFEIRRLDGSGGFISIVNYCNPSSNAFSSFGSMPYLQSINRIRRGEGCCLNPFLKVVSNEVTDELLLNTCEQTAKTAFEQSVIYKIVNNIQVNGISVRTQEQRLTSEYVDKIKLNIINPQLMGSLEDKIKLLFNDKSETANNIFRIG